MRRALFALCVVMACAPTLPEAYLRARSRAEAAYSEGHYADAAQAWLHAAQATPRARDRVEARFRAAVSYERAAQFERARALYRDLLEPPNERSAHAAFALAELELRRDPNAAYRAFEALMVRYANSGLARAALDRCLIHSDEEHGSAATLAWLEQLAPALDHSELAEALAYARARRLEALGETEPALAAYLALADRFVYPQGAYWDDALYHAASCAEKLGQPERAIALLERMLAEREVAHLEGSYERPRFAEAAFHIAEIYRDELHEPVRARRAFRHVFTDFTTSLLRDDALWNEAEIAQVEGDARGACAAAQLLVNEFPESRYAGCLPRLCPSLHVPAEKPCHDYITRALGTRAARAE